MIDFLWVAPGSCEPWPRFEERHFCLAEGQDDPCTYPLTQRLVRLDAEFRTWSIFSSIWQPLPHSQLSELFQLRSLRLLQGR